MVDNIKSLHLEFTNLDNVEIVERGIIVHAPAWDCFLGFPFQKRHLQVLLGE